MQLGRLNRRITISEKEVVRDSLGGETITWTEVCTVWAAVLPIRGREYVAIRDAGAELTARFLIHYRAGITPAMRITHGMQHYEIVDVINPESSRRMLEIMARAEAVGS